MNIDPTEDVYHETDAQHHVTPLRIYVTILGLLLVATGITVAVAFVDMGHFSTPVALLIATIKAGAVILWFMHVKYSSRLTWAVVVGSFFWLAVLFVLTLADYLSRYWIES